MNYQKNTNYAILLHTSLVILPQKNKKIAYMGRYYMTQMLRLLKDKKLDSRLLDKKLAILAVKAEAEGYFNVMTAIDSLREMKNGPKPIPRECKHRFFDAMKRACANPND